MKFRLRSLLLAIAAVGIVLAPIAPWYRGMNERQQSVFASFLLVAAMGMAATGVLLMPLRRFRRRRMGECLLRFTTTRRSPETFVWAFVLVFSGLMICSKICLAVTLQGLRPEPIETMNLVLVFEFGVIFAVGILGSLSRWHMQMEICEHGILANGVVGLKWRSMKEVGWVKESGYLRLKMSYGDISCDVPADQRDLLESILAKFGKLPEPTLF